MPRLFHLGGTYSPREIIHKAYGHTPHPLSPDPLEYHHLPGNGSIAYHTCYGEAAGTEWWTVLFARIENGRAKRMPDESKSFTSQSGMDLWINSVARSGTVS